QRALSHQRPEVELVSLQGNHDEAVLRNPEDRAFHSFDSDDAVRQPANVDFTAHRIAGGKKFGGDVRADISDSRCAFCFRIDKEAPELDIPVVDVGSVGRGAADESVFEYLIAALNLG